MAEVKLNLQADLTGNIKQEIDAVTSSLDKMNRASGSSESIIDKSRSGGAGVGRGYRESGGLGSHIGEGLSTAGGSFARSLIGIGAGPAALATFATVSDRAARSINILANSTSSLVDKQEALLGVIIPFYDKFAGLRDAITGVTESLRVLRMETEASVGRTQAEGTALIARRDAQRQAFGAEAIASAFGSNPLGARIASADLMSSGGRNAYQDALTRQAAEDAVVRANRSVDAAIPIRDRDAAIMRSAELRRDAAQRALIAAQRAVSQNRIDQINATVNGRLPNWIDPGGGLRAGWGAVANSGEMRLQQERTQSTFNTAQAEATAAQAAFEAANRDSVRSSQQAQEAITAQKKAQLEIDKAQLEILERREQRMASLQQRIGSLNDAEYRAATNALTSVRRYGLQASTSESVRLAGLIAPQEIFRLQNERGISRIGGQVNLFGTGRDDLADYANGQTQIGVQQGVVSIRARLSSQVDSLEGELARNMATVIANAMERLIKNVQDELDKRVTEINNRMLQNRAGQ